MNARESAEADLAEAVELLSDGVVVSARLLDGPPTDMLIEAAADLDLLVMGSRAHGPVRRVLLGSISHGVLLRCPSPVLVVPRGAQAPEPAPSGASTAASAQG